MALGRNFNTLTRQFVRQSIRIERRFPWHWARWSYRMREFPSSQCRFPGGRRLCWLYRRINRSWRWVVLSISGCGTLPIG